MFHNYNRYGQHVKKLFVKSEIKKGKELVSSLITKSTVCTIRQMSKLN